MNSITAVFHIWWKAILVNACLYGLYAMFEEGLKGLLMLFLFFIVGFFVSFPLLPVACLIIEAYQLLPYENAERKAWLCFMLVAMIWICFTVIIYTTTGDFNDVDGLAYMAASATSVAMLTAVWLSKTQLTALNK